MIRVAVASYWHVHADEYTHDVLNHPEAELAYVWDEDPARGEAKAAEYGVPFVADFDELIGKDDLDAVIFVTPTTMHRDLMVRTAKAGKHIYTEKVITATNAELAEVLQAVKEAGVVMVTSLPRLYHNYSQPIDELVFSGKLGRITNVRVRLSHNGALDGWLPEHFFDPAQTAGGALIDLGCHPVYLTTRWIGGLPTSVSAHYASFTGRAVEDNAVAVLRHDNGAIGVAEAGFANRCTPFEIEIHGTDGSLFWGTPEEKLLVRLAGEDGFREVPVGDDLPKAFSHFVEAVKAPTEIAEKNLEAAIWLTQVMDAANRSAAEGGAVVKVDAVG